MSKVVKDGVMLKLISSTLLQLTINFTISPFQHKFS